MLIVDGLRLMISELKVETSSDYVVWEVGSLGGYQVVRSLRPEGGSWERIGYII